MSNSSTATPRSTSTSSQRPYGRWALLALPSVLAVVVDLANRPARIRAFSLSDWSAYIGTCLATTVVWSLLLVSCRQRSTVLRRSFSVTFVLLYTSAMGSQLYFFQDYSSYLNRDLSVFASNFTDSIVSQLWADAPRYLASKLPFLIVALALLWVTAPISPPKRLAGLRLSSLTILVAIGAWFLPISHRRTQAAPPDALYFNALGGLGLSALGLIEESTQVRPRARNSRAVQSMTPALSTPRNVVLVITESVRADAACSSYSPDCNKTPYTNALLPQRVGIGQLRALDSTTAISLAVLWAGVAPNETRDILHSWPLLFDYANAAGFDTAFWTSQNLMFGNTRLWVKNLGARLQVSGTELEPTADLDLGADEALLAAHVGGHWSQLQEPFLAVIQLSNTHYPYLVKDAGPHPFEPYAFDKSEEGLPLFRNYYQNAIAQQDEHVARMLRSLRASPAGSRSVVVYTSDHGEAFRDHHQLGHTFTLFDEEIKVPGFVDAPPGSLSPEERGHLVQRARGFATHLDVAPTVLDLMGVWDAPELSPFRARMPGSSLIREAPPARTLPMTNCAGVWSCAFQNWGVLRGQWKLFARTPYDTGWQCHDLLKDPQELHRSTAPECAQLQRQAEHWFGRLPE